MKLKAHKLIDWYKGDHVHQYDPATEFVFSNFTCRSTRHFKGLEDYDGKIVFFGLQGVCRWLLIDLWNETFFKQPKEEVLAEMARDSFEALGRHLDLSHFGALHDLGYLPIRIKALPEGSRVKARVPMWTIQNTKKEFFWLVNYLETQLSAEQWKPITSATTAYEYYRLIDKYAKMTGVDNGFQRWQGHDFSMRGMSGVHDAVNSGAGHLTSFLGTDTYPASDYLREYYPRRDPKTGYGGSVVATEHSVMCMGGPGLNEIETFRRLITQTYPSGICSIVSDTWDFWKVITDYTLLLHREILSRDGKVVFRPDSGDPVKIICGDPDAPEGSPEHGGAVECLWNIFGGTYNEGSNGKRYRTLDSHVGLIYGDSITLERAAEILRRLEAKGFSSANIVFGIGSFTYQFVTRDTFGSAIKATFGIVDGGNRELYKDPKTDDGTKKSARGLIRIDRDFNGDYCLHDQQTWEAEARGHLETVFIDSRMQAEQSIDDVRLELHGEVF